MGKGCRMRKQQEKARLRKRAGKGEEPRYGTRAQLHGRTRRVDGKTGTRPRCGQGGTVPTRDLGSRSSPGALFHVDLGRGCSIIPGGHSSQCSLLPDLQPFGSHTQASSSSASSVLISALKQLCGVGTQDQGKRAVERGGGCSKLRKGEINLDRINTEVLAGQRGPQPQGRVMSGLAGPCWSNSDLLWLRDCPKGLVSPCLCTGALQSHAGTLQSFGQPSHSHG